MTKRQAASTDRYTFTVSTAKYRVKVRTRDPFDAAVSAVKTGKFKTMGALMQIDRKGGETCYVLSESACKAAGMWADK